MKTLWANLDSQHDNQDNQDTSNNQIDQLHVLESIARLQTSPLSARLGLSLAVLSHRLDMTRAVFQNPDAPPIPYEYMSFVNLVRVASILSTVHVTDGRLLGALTVGIAGGELDALRPDALVDLLKSMAGINWQGTKNDKARITAAALRNRRHLDAAAAVGLLHLLTRAASGSQRGRAEDIRVVSDIVDAFMDELGMKELGMAAKAYGRLLVDEGAVSQADTVDNARKRSYDVELTHDAEFTVKELARAMLDRIAGQAVVCVENTDASDPKDVVRLIQAFQTAEMKPEGLLDVLDVWADKRLAAMNASGISLAMAHFARVGEASPRLLKTAVKVAEANVEGLTASDASRLMWAFAHLQYDPGNVLRRKGMRVLERYGQTMSDRELANLFWGLVRLEEYPSLRERENIAAALWRAPGKVSGQSAALLLWSFASSQDTIGYQESNALDSGGLQLTDDCFEESMHRLGMDVCADMGSVDSQSVSMTAWSLGVLKIKHTEFAACLDTLGDKLQAFEPQHVANLVWGLAKSTSRPSTKFLLDVADVLSGRMRLYSPQELFNVCWGFATMEFPSQGVAAETLGELRARGSEFGGLELSGISWALSRMLKRSDDPSIAEGCSMVIQKQLTKHVGELEPSQVAMAIAGIGRLVSLSGTAGVPKIVDAELITEMVVSFSAAFGGTSQPTISSVNTLLEGLALCRKSSASLAAHRTLDAALRDGDNLSRCLSRAQFWEVCDLCYYMSRNDMPLAKRVLVDINATVATERVTPRGAIMLLDAMHRCSVYPPMIVDKTTNKLSALSPNYRLGEEWLMTLRHVLREDTQLNERVHFDHAVWNERIL